MCESLRSPGRAKEKRSHVRWGQAGMREDCGDCVVQLAYSGSRILHLPDGLTHAEVNAERPPQWVTTATAVPQSSLSARDAAIGASAQRKASLHLLPIIGIGYGLAMIDRINIERFASLAHEQAISKKFPSASVYGFGAGLFFIGHGRCEVPSNLMMLRFGARGVGWRASCFTWGLLAAAMMLVRTPMGVQRPCACCSALQRRASSQEWSTTSRYGSRLRRGRAR